MGMGNSYGRLFRISTWGESHGGGVGVTVDGCPPRIPLTAEDIQVGGSYNMVRCSSLRWNDDNSCVLGVRLAMVLLSIFSKALL